MLPLWSSSVRNIPGATSTYFSILGGLLGGVVVLAVESGVAAKLKLLDNVGGSYLSRIYAVLKHRFG